MTYIFMVCGNMSTHLLDVNFISFCYFLCVSSSIFIGNPFDYICLKELDGAYFLALDP